MRVLFMTNVPSPYRVDFFNELGKYCELTVLFETNIAKSRDASWKPTDFTDFKAVFLKGIKVGEAEAISIQALRYLSKKQYDLIVVGIYSSPTGMMAIEYMKIRKIPFIISSDGGLIKNDHGIRFNIKARYIGAASAWLSTGDATTDYLCHYGAQRDNVFIYPFSSVYKKDILSEPVGKTEKIQLRSELNMKEDRIFVSVGQFIYRKGYDVLLRACQNIDDSIGVYIIGGDATEEYKKLIDELQLKNVHFIGFSSKEQLKKYYQAADVFVLPTREDIWGLVVNEAMANGLPVITTDKCVAGIEMITSKVTGDIIPVESVSALKETLQISDTYDRQEVLKTAEQYSIEGMVRAHILCFEMMLEKKSGMRCI